MGERRRERSQQLPDLLTVDDDPAITDFLRWVLRPNYHVTACANVDEALSAIRLRAPDAVITDLEMDGGGGEHLLIVLATAYPTISRIVFSSEPAPELARLVRNGLAHAAVSKSEELAALVDKLRVLVHPWDGEASDEPTLENDRK